MIYTFSTEEKEEALGVPGHHTVPSLLPEILKTSNNANALAIAA
jgi:hypothetical protein